VATGFFFLLWVSGMRVCIFFDGKNFHSGWRDEAAGKRLAFPKLSRWLVERVGGALLWGAYYYTGIETGPAAASEGQKKLAGFLDMLELQPGFFVKRFPRKTSMFQCAACGVENKYTQEKEVDTTMVADMLRLAAVGAFDVVVLVSGDADHAPAVEGVRAIGRQAYVSTWGRVGLSSRLRKAAFDHIDLLEGLSFFEDADEGSSAPAPPALVPDPRPPGEEGEVPLTAFTAPPCEDTLAQDGSNGLPPVPTDPPTEEEAVFLEELRAAERRLRHGYVGANYFVTRWQSNRLDPSSEGRRRMLENLIATGRIELYHAADGNAALRTR
jgi:uncharacterized LabA/DUF88 family protein